MQDDAHDVERQLDAWAARQSHVGMSPELERNVREALKSSLTAVKPVPSRGWFFLAFITIFVVGSAGLLAFFTRLGLQLMTPVQISVISVIFFGGGTLFACKLTEQMIPGSRPGIPLWGLLTVGGVFVLGGLATLFPWQTPGISVSQGWPCALMEVTIVIPAIAVSWLLARRGALFASAGLGATLTGLAAFLALIPVQFHCMFQLSPHLLIWHGGAALLMVGLGALGGNLCRGRLIW